MAGTGLGNCSKERKKISETIKTVSSKSKGRNNSCLLPCKISLLDLQLFSHQTNVSDKHVYNNRP